MSLELSCENLAVALLAAQVDLASFEIKNFADDDTAVEKNRIIVRATPEQPLVPAHKPSLPAKVSQVPLEITVRSMDQTAAQLDTVWSAVKTAFDSAPASVVTTASGLFPNGFTTDDTEDGDQSRGENVREWQKVYNAVFCR